MAEWVEELQRYNNWTLTPLEFKKRYRIGKGPVKELCDDFWASGFCGNKSHTAGVRRLGYDERVCYNTIITMYYNHLTMCHVYKTMSSPIGVLFIVPTIYYSLFPGFGYAAVYEHWL